MYVFLYKETVSDDKYSMVCFDTLEEASIPPLRCDEDVHTDAEVVRESYNFRDWIISRKNLVVSGDYPLRHHGIYEAEQFSDNVPDYQCAVSPNAQTTLNYVENAKAKELNNNKI